MMGLAGQRDDSNPGGVEQDGKRFHCTTHSGMQFETYKLFNSGTFHLMLPWLIVGNRNLQQVKLWVGQEYFIRFPMSS